MPTTNTVIQPPAKLAAEQQHGYFDPPVIGALIVGLVLGWFAHWLTSRREAGHRRRAFRDFISALDDEFAAQWRDARIMDSTDFDNWNMFASHYASVPRVRAEAIKVREDIRWWRRRSFDAACEAYASFGAEVNFESNHTKCDRIRRESHALLKRLSHCAS
jgi:hypothetical protein